MIRDGYGYLTLTHVFCMTMWLPRLRTSTKPWRATIAQTSLPERTRSLPSGNLHLGDVDVAMEALLHLFGRCAFEKQLQRFPKIVPGLFNTVPLAGNIQLRTQRHIAIAFSFDNCRQLHPMTPFENPRNRAISF